MTAIYSILSFILILLPLVILHEFGHYFSAKFFKIKVLEFGFGFPPKLFSKCNEGHDYKVAWFLDQRYHKGYPLFYAERTDL